MHLEPSRQQEFQNPSLTMGSRGWYPWWDCPRLGGSGWLLLLWPCGWPCLPNLFRGAQASRRGPTASRSRGHRGWSHSQAVDGRWPSSACRWDRLGAWGQGWWWLLLLLVHLLEVLLPGPHLCVLQLLHVEGLSVGQELLPLILQLPVPIEYCYPCSEDPEGKCLAPALSADTPSLSFWWFPTSNPNHVLGHLVLPAFPSSSGCPCGFSLIAMELIWGAALTHFSSKALNLSLI